jgi:hypothetical protein
MSRNYQDPDQQRDQELHQLRGYRGQEAKRQGEKTQFNGASSITRQKIDHFIDQLAQKVPGSSQYAQRVKDATATFFHQLEVRSEKYGGSFGDFFNRLFGGR